MLDAGGGGGMASMASMGASMASFKQAAAAGSFAVNESGGQALLKAIRDMATWVDSKHTELNFLAKEQPLGTSNGANLMKPYLVDVATDDKGFVTQLREFRKSLADAEQGILDAMKNYKNTEQDVQGTFRVV